MFEIFCKISSLFFWNFFLYSSNGHCSIVYCGVWDSARFRETIWAVGACDIIIDDNSVGGVTFVVKINLSRWWFFLFGDIFEVRFKESCLDHLMFLSVSFSWRLVSVLTLAIVLSLVDKIFFGYEQGFSFCISHSIVTEPLGVCEHRGLDSLNSQLVTLRFLSFIIC